MAQQPVRGTFTAVFAVPEFRALWFAELLSVAGDQLARVAVSILVYQRTNSATLTGLTYALTFVPSFFGGLFLSGLADRFPRREVMVIIDLARAVLIVLAAIPGVPLALLCVLIASVSLLNAPFKAAQLALLPTVLPGELYLVGMAARNITIQSAQLAGFAGGGLLVTALSPYVAFGLDSLTFLLSAVLLWRGVQQRPAPRTTAEDMTGDAPDSAVRTIWRQPGLRALIVTTWLSGWFVAHEALAAPYSAAIGGGTAAVGLLLAADPLGSVIGAYLWGRWVPPHLRPRLIGVMSVLSGVPLLFCFLNPGLISSMLLFALAGALGTAALMQSTASFSLAVPDAGRARALGLSNTGMTTVQGLGPLVAGLAADGLGPARSVGLVGAVGVAVAIPVAVAWRRAQVSHAAV